MGVVALELDEGGLADEVAPKEHAVANLMLIQMGSEVGTGEGGTWFDGDFEAEPRTIGAAAGGVPREIGIRTAGGVRGGGGPGGGVGGEGEIDVCFKAVEAATEGFPIFLAGLDEVAEAAELDAADGCLWVEGLEVVAEVAVDVFVVVALGEFAELPLEALAAGVVFSGRAPAVSAPVAEGLGVGFEAGAADDIDSAAFAHGEVVGRVVTLGGDVAESTGVGGELTVADVGVGLRPLAFGVFFGEFEEMVESQALGLEDGKSVSAAEGVAVVLNEPEVVFLAESEDGGEVKGVTKGVGHHHGFGFTGDEGCV